MRVHKQTLLYYQSGNSDKVYEVDLVEVSEGRFLVNFRYGRRGSNLRHGSKTSTPVPLGKAEQIFDKLVDSKVSKGYLTTASAPIPEPTQAPEPKNEETQDPREVAILSRLWSQADESSWPLDRVIWRAGLKKLKAATAPIATILKSTANNNNRIYCCLCALARIQAPAQDTLETIEALRTHPQTPDFIKRMCFEALLSLTAETSRPQAPFWKDLQEIITKGIQSQAGENAEAVLNQAIAKAASSEDGHFLWACYLTNSPATRPALLAALQQGTYSEKYFGFVRSIYKTTELRDDAEFYAACHQQFRKRKGNIASWNWDRKQRRYIRNPTAFTRETKSYLQRRNARWLKKLGELNSGEYTSMATEVLLNYSDEDANPVRRAYQTYDRFAKHWALNSTIYGNSPRYKPNRTGTFYYCRNYRPGDKAPDQREEAYPELWDQSPESLFKLLKFSQCGVVHEFAVKAISENSNYLAEMEASQITALLEQNYEITAELGFELAKERYNPEEPDLELALAVANCKNARARIAARSWIKKLSREQLTIAFISELAFSDYHKNRVCAKDLLLKVSFEPEFIAALFAKFIAEIQNLKEANSSLLRDTLKLISEVFPEQVASLSGEVIYDLIDNGEPGARYAGGRLLLSHPRLRSEASDGCISSFLESKHPELQEIGGELLSYLRDELLIERLELILGLHLHPEKRVRNAVHAAYLRLVKLSSDARERIIQSLLITLYRKRDEEILSSALAVLQEELSEYVQKLPPEAVFRLLRAPAKQANSLGEHLLKESIRADQLTLRQIALLADHEVRAVRQQAQQFSLQRISELARSNHALLGLTNSSWEDTRVFAFELIQEKIDKTAINADLLVAICDSSRPEVREFGRGLILERFKTEDGPEYLIKLSEHPSEDLQLFASQYLEEYARDNYARLKELEYYFNASLNKINKGRVTKSRLLKFLHREAMKDTKTANLVTGILDRLSLTISIEYRAACIEILLDIQDRYPEVSTPLKLIEDEVRHAI